MWIICLLLFVAKTQADNLRFFLLGHHVLVARAVRLYSESGYLNRAQRIELLQVWVCR